MEFLFLLGKLKVCVLQNTSMIFEKLIMIVYIS